MKIYISLPISGYSIDRCKARAERIKAMINEKGYEAVTPFDICPDQGKPYSYYMGRDIETLLECDAIFLSTGWSGSRGCSLEWQCALIFKKQIIDHISKLPNLKS